MVFGAIGASSLLTGCTVSSPVSQDKTPSAPAELAPDVAVATSALAAIRAAREAASSTLVRFPVVRPQLALFVQLHRAHEATLADAVPMRARDAATSAPYVVPRRRQVALDHLATREQQLHATLDGLALHAQSGDFARLLASMGGAIAQRLAGWPK